VAERRARKAQDRAERLQRRFDQLDSRLHEDRQPRDADPLECADAPPSRSTRHLYVGRLAATQGVSGHAQLSASTCAATRKSRCLRSQKLPAVSLCPW
jgi:hypothetical protein